MNWDRLEIALRNVDDLRSKDIVAELVDGVGVPITGLIGGAKSGADVKQWLHGERPPNIQALRSALQVVRILIAGSGPAAAQGWLMGINPNLDERNPIELLRSQDIAEREAVVRAALRFIL